MDERPFALIVEDVTDWRESLCYDAEVAGYQPIEARTLEQARAALEGRHFTLAIVDVRLRAGRHGDESGLEFIREAWYARSVENFVIVSGYAFEEDIRAALGEDLHFTFIDKGDLTRDGIPPVLAEVFRLNRVPGRANMRPEETPRIFSRPLRTMLLSAQADAESARALATHLSPLQRSNDIDLWEPSQLLAGCCTRERLIQELEAACLILPLLSPALIYEERLPGELLERALQLHTMRRAWLVPILLRPVVLEGTAWDQYQRLPRDGKPILVRGERDVRFAGVCADLRSVIGDLARPD